ncbi:MAG: lipopolysaccharide biosynthesis protein [Lacibacter sp.]
MGQIRKQAIISSIVTYIGFAIGFVNTWLFIRSGEHSFTPAQYGLTRLFFDLGQLIFAVASLGIPPVLLKFFPYYRDRLPLKQNDLYTWTLVFPLIGFVLVLIGGFLFEPLIVRKFSERSELFVLYYPWVFFFGLGTLLFSIFETFSWTHQQTILPNFLRETGLRILTSILLLLFYFRFIGFDTFIKLFSFLFLVIALILGVTLKAKNYFGITFQISTVTQKFKKKMLALSGYVYSGTIIVILSQVADTIIIAGISKKGIHDAGVYNLATYIANLIQVPQRSIIAVTVPALSIAWKNKNLPEINRLYRRTSINLLLLGLFIFTGIWLNIHEIFRLIHIQSEYETGLYVILILGITKIIDAGTGVNAQIIATSSQWKFEFYTGIILVVLILPLNYFLVKHLGIIGSAYANLISFTIYNTIRYFFLWTHYKLQPFNMKTLYSIVMAVVVYGIAYVLFKDNHNWMGIVYRSCLYAALFISGIFLFRLTPDALQLTEQLRTKWKKN